MNRHPLDPIALVAGVITVVAGVVALLHQTGTVSLGPATVILLGLVVLGIGGGTLVVLVHRGRAESRDPAHFAS